MRVCPAFLPLSLMTSCGPSAGLPSEGDLAVSDGWTVVSDEDDPFIADRPGSVVCPSSSVQEEGTILEIDTGRCNWVTLSQPTLVDVEPGQSVNTLLWHNDLWFEEPVMGHATVMLDTWTLLDLEVEIPHSAEVYDTTELAVEAWPAGAPLYLHIDNHGANAWRLGHIAIE